MNIFLAVIGVCAAILVGFIVLYPSIGGTYTIRSNESDANVGLKTDNYVLDTEELATDPEPLDTAINDAEVAIQQEQGISSETITTPEPVIEEKNNSPTIGQENALQSAKSYLNVSAFSYQGLIDQLEYEKYSVEDATYEVDNCGADWNEQALKSAQNYLNISAFSYQGLYNQLVYEKYTSDQAVYAVDNCGADWNEQVAKSATSYLNIMSFSRDSLIDQLVYDGYTKDQAVYGVEANGY